MANSYYGDQAVVLPSVFPSQEMSQAIAYKERDKERQYQRDQDEQRRREAENKQNTLYNLRELDQATAFEQYKTPLQRINDFVHGQLNDIYNDALTNYIKLDPVEMKYRLQQRISRLHQWDSSVKTAAQQAEQGLAQFKQKYTGVDPQKAYGYVYGKIAEDFLDLDQMGKPVMKDPSMAQPRDYVAELQNPNILGKMMIDTSGFAKFMHAMPLRDIGDKQYTSKQGRAKGLNWKGKVTDDSELFTDDDNKPAGTRLKGEDVQGGKIVTQDFYEKVLGNPDAYSSLVGMWDRYKQANGVPDNLNPNVEDGMFRKFMYTQANNLTPQDLQFDTKDITPKPSQVNIYNQNTDGKYINDVYKSVDDEVNADVSKGYGATRINALNTDAQNTIMEFVRKTSGDNDIGHDDIFLHKNKEGQIAIYKTTSDENGKKQLKITTNKLIGFLPKVGTNIKVQPGAAEKRAVIQQGNAPTQPKKTTADEEGIN